jgi:2-polyprenyl-3-methyl-5-hydroxy-6-metoxy-1,4-benzoquinol methylase
LTTELLRFSVEKNTADEQMLANLHDNMRAGLPVLKVRRAVIVGGGPSLTDHIDDIKRDQEDGFRVFALGNTADFLASRGIIPDYHVCYDARPENIEFFRSGVAKKYLVASHVHPDLRDVICASGKPVHMFHAMGSKVTSSAVLDKDPKAHILGCGITVGMQMLNILVAMGFRDSHFYGYDSSDRDDAHHAYEQPLNDKHERLDFSYEDVRYRSDIVLAAQAQEFVRTAPEYERLGLRIRVFGSGLLPHMWRSLEEKRRGVVYGKSLEQSEREKYELIWGDAEYRKFSPGEVLVDYFVNICKPEPGDTVADLGCGSGRASKILANKGFVVTPVDITDKCLDPSNQDLPLVVQNLWQLDIPPVDWVYCCDVMEHIPPDKVNDVLDNIKKIARKGAFFNIAFEPDAFGATIGVPLRLTVRSQAWWANTLDMYFKNVKAIIGNGLFICFCE